MKKVLSIFVLITAAIVLFSLNDVSAEPTNVSVLSGPFGTGSYALSASLEEMSKKYSTKVNINASETPGLVFNAKKMDKEPESKKSMFMSFTVGINYLATNGLKPFEKTYPSAMLIANYNLGSVWLASLNQEINSKESLKGKKIALGRGTQILWAIEPRLLITHGWNMYDDMDIQYVGTKPAASALLDGLVDAAIIGGYADPIGGKFKPSPQTIELLASGKSMSHIPWGKDAVQNVINQGVPIAHLQVPKNAVEGLEKDLNVFCDPIAWCAYPEFDDDLAYEVTKMIINNVKQFEEYHSLGTLMSEKSLVYGWNEENIHPGALKAYKEAGIIK